MATIVGGGAGGRGNVSGASGGINSPTGAGGVGGSGFTSLAGGGGGAGASTGGAGAINGGMGGVHGYVGAGLPTGAATGTAGADGQDGGPNTWGGGGGGGGYGAVITGSGDLGILTAAVSGAAGGDGGYSAGGYAGDGGRGGIGLYFDSASGTTVTIGATVSGGNGGSGGPGIFADRAGTAGAGGEGIYGSNLTLTLASSGSITGGQSGDGVTRANAVYFASGNNRLSYEGGTITGNVVANGSTDYFYLGGAAGGTFDVSTIGTQFQGFEGFRTTGGGTWTLTGTSTQSHGWLLGPGTMIVNASMANASFSVSHNVVLGGTGTVGSVSVVGGTINAGAVNSTGILHIGDFAMALGNVAIDIAGTTVGTGYDQLSITGTVSLAGRPLNVSLLNAFAPTIGSSFTIIANDGSDAVYGTFSGLSEGYTLIVGRQAFTISYRGGDGNDVVLTSVAAIVGGGGADFSGGGGLNNPTGTGGAGTSGSYAGGGGGAGYLVGGAGAAAPEFGSGAGGDGGIHGFLGATLPTIGAAGSDGEAGEAGSGFARAGGGGGAGGYGAVITGSGDLGTLTAAVAGGDGGAGGSGTGTYGGDGGRGGIGLWLGSDAAKTITVASAITGGDGGTGGGNVYPIRYGDPGAGGEGVYGSNLTVTLASSGSITGGLSGDGVTRNNAIFFASGTNLLDIQGGTITGNVQANGSNDTLRLSGSAGGSFDVSGVSGFEQLGSAGSGTWTLTGTNTAAQSWTTSSGRLVVNATMANTDFTIGSGATLGGSGTLGDVTIQAGGTLGPGNSPGIIQTGDFTLTGTLAIEIAGTTAGTGYDQIDVTGTVTLSGLLSVSFLSGFVAATGNSFTIIDNDGSDAVSGSFSGLSEGYTLIVGRQAFTITYKGGDGNDVVLTSVAAIVGGGQSYMLGFGGINNPTGPGGNGTSASGGGGGGAGATVGGAGGVSPSGVAGGTGGTHGHVGAALPSGVAAGTAGGNGAHGTGGSDGGGGGAGGYGAVVTGSGNLGTLVGQVSGGTGGAGGNSDVWVAGSGGRGGIGLWFDSANGATVSVAGSVSGGAGGAGAVNSYESGTAGAGGEGIYGSNLTITLASTGSITGGLSGDGVTRANAVLFTSGSNTFNYEGGTITGNVVANGTADYFNLSGTTGGTFDVSSIGTQFQGFEAVQTMGGTWTLTGNYTPYLSWGLLGGMTIVDAAMATTNFTVAGATVLGGTGTVGNVQLLAGTVNPGAANGTGVLHVSDFILGSGVVTIDIASTTVGTGYDQVSVRGLANLTGGTLNVSLLNQFAPSIGDSFTIIDYNGSSNSPGNFQGLREGYTLISGNHAFKISYKGGDGNDVVLTSVAGIVGGGTTKFNSEGGINNPTGAGGAGAGGDGGAGGGAGYLVGGAGGQPAYSGSGSGGAGGTHGYLGAALPVGPGNGSHGSAGQDSSSGVGDGGGGGGGGYGAVITGAGSLGTLTRAVTGYNGGDGGDADRWYGGDGGRGGIGLYFDSEAAKDVTISAAVTGGNGGAPGASSLSGWSGTAGDGGEGIYGSNLTITLTSAGSITGGLSGDGVARANAIKFTGGTNTLNYEGGTITGNVVASGSNDRFNLTGTTGGTFDVSALGTQFKGFESLGNKGSGAWTLTGATTLTNTWFLEGKLIVDASMTNVTFAGGVGSRLGGSGNIGNVSLVGGIINPGEENGTGILHTGNLTLNLGTIKIELAGTTAGTGYDQLSVTGTVSLNSKPLNVSLLNSFAPSIGDSFTIIDNDGSDAISGTFRDLLEGYTLLVGRQAFTISYKGGDGNDVVLTSVAGIVGGGSASTGDGNHAGGINNPTGTGGAGVSGYAGGGGGGAGAGSGGAGGNATTIGAAGGAGGVHGYVGSTLPSSSQAGTNGQDGGDGSASKDGGGGGGGGYGAVLTGSGDLATLTASVTGGAGGAGGDSVTYGGSGGRGGIGLYINSTDGTSLTIASGVTGGNGGAAGVGSIFMENGDPGAGGEGVYGSNLSITLTSAGSITGGLSGDGVTRADAIRFTSGTNTLTYEGGTITGNVQANGTNDTFRLAGSTGGTFDVSTIGGSGQYRGFENLASTGSATWTLTGTNTATQSWTSSSATLVVDATMANTDFTVSSGVLVGSGHIGALDIGVDARVGGESVFSILHTGDFSLSGTARFQITGLGTTAGTDYNQISVAGAVTLSGTLNIAKAMSAPVPSYGSVFTLIVNDDTDAVSGTFANLDDGEMFAGFGGRYFRIDYDGGDGNDVVLTVVSPVPTQSANTGATVAEGGSVVLSATDLAFTDTDQTAGNLVYTITSAATNGTLYVNGKPAGLGDTFTQQDIDNGLVSYTHDGGETTSAGFGFSLGDGQNNTITGQSFTFDVTAVNDDPTLATAIGDQIATEDADFSFQFAANTFADVDPGDRLSYTATLTDGSPLRSWLSFDAATRTFSGTPANGDVGTISVKVTASDGTASASDTFDITVGNTNDGPTVAAAIADQVATEDAPFAFQFASGTFADEDLGDTLSYTATLADGSPLPSWLSFDAATRTFSGTPANGDVGTISVKVTASDGTASVSDTFDITVGNTNDGPTVAAAIADQAATEDSAFSFQFASGTFADVDTGDTLSYTATLADGSALPSWLSFDAATRTFSGTPANGDVGTISVKVTASDGTATASDTFDITVGNTNDGPTVAAAIADQVATEDSAFSFQFASGTFADEDLGDTLTYTATLADGSALPSWLTFDAATRTFSGTPANGDVGTISVKVTASDGTASASDTFDIIVGNTNDGPTVAAAIADQAATEDSAFSFQFASGTFADVDTGDTLSYTATLADGSALPSWLSFDAATRTFSGTPANGDVGTISVKVTASDGTASASDTFGITVGNTNDGPTVAAAIADQTATEDSPFSFQFAASTFADEDLGDTLTYTATLADGSALPAWLTFDAATRTFSGTPANGDVGTISVKVTASDGTASASDTFDITVGNTNDGPTVAAAIADQVATEDSAFSFQFASGTFADEDLGDTLAYSATLADGSPLPSWLSFDAATRTFSGTPANGDVGTISVKVTASDGTASASDTFDITVGNTNDGPTVAAAIADQTATEDSAFSFQFASGTFADDDLGDTLSYTATLADGSALPSWLTFDAATRTFSGTPANGDVGTISVKVTASDGTATASDTFDITVGNTNDGPTVAAAIADQTATEDSPFSFQFASGTFADVDTGDILTYTATLADGSALPAWLSFDAATRTFSGTPANGDVGTISVKVTASDGTASASDTFDITVGNTNDGPTVAAAIADQVATEDSAFSFQFAANTFADEDLGDTLTYTATLADGSALPAWLSFDAATRTFSGTPANGDVGTISVKVTASDGTADVSDTFDITVGNTNDGPTVAAAIADQTATEDSPFSFQFAASTFADEDLGDTLTYTATLADGSALPSWLSFDAATRTFSGTPANGDVGTISVKVTASDGTASASDTFDITVGNTNDGPTVAAAIADQVATEDSAFAFQFASETFADVDTGDTLTYTATLADGSPLPSWLSFDAATRTFSGTPANGDVGTISVKVTASDGTASASDTFDIAVGNTNDAPTGLSVEPIVVIDGKTLHVDENSSGASIGTVSASDPDQGDSLTYAVDDARFEILDGVLKLKSGVRLDYEKEASVDITITASDLDGASQESVFTVNVTDRVDIISGTRRGDWLLGTNGDDRIFGKRGDDVLLGRGGDDRLRSKAGDDRFWGGDGADTFVFSTDSGHDRIMVFETGIDTIDVSRWQAVDDFSDIKALAENRRGDLWIVDGNDALIIENFAKRDLDAGDFIFGG